MFSECRVNVPSCEHGDQRKLSDEAREDFRVAVNRCAGEGRRESELWKIVKTSSSSANLFRFSYENVMGIDKAAGFSGRQRGGLGLVMLWSQRWQWRWWVLLLPAAGLRGLCLPGCYPHVLTLRISLVHAIVNWTAPLRFYLAWWFYLSLDYWKARMQRICEAAKLPFHYIFPKRQPRGILSIYSRGRKSPSLQLRYHHSTSF